MKDWKGGDILIHKMTLRKVIVISICSDGVIYCRTCDDAGIYTTVNFYKEELMESEPDTLLKAGFKSEKVSK